MRIAIVGLGIQGEKRLKYLKNDIVLTIDPYNSKADYRKIEEAPLQLFDTVFICTPDKPKFEIIKFFLNNKKNVLVEKPLWTDKIYQIKNLERLAKKNNVILYTGYNHRFEPHIIKMKKLILSKKLGKIYSCRIFYGNGTAQLVKNTSWKNKGPGVLVDLGSHLLDISTFFFGKNLGNFKLVSASKFENNSFDHAIIINDNLKIRIELEMTFCMWRNYFSCDLLAEKGSAHIKSLCKWGPSTFIYRKRIFPSGKPREKKIIIKQRDPTWSKEYLHLKKIIKSKNKTNLFNDLWIYSQLTKIFNSSKK